LDLKLGLLWIEFGKTKRSKRTLEVPALLRPYLLALAKGRARCTADQPLGVAAQRQEAGSLLAAVHVERLCSDADVPVVCTQSLRGLHTSVATWSRRPFVEHRRTRPLG